MSYDDRRRDDDRRQQQRDQQRRDDAARDRFRQANRQQDIRREQVRSEQRRDDDYRLEELKRQERLQREVYALGQMVSRPSQEATPPSLMASARIDKAAGSAADHAHDCWNDECTDSGVQAIEQDGFISKLIMVLTILFFVLLEALWTDTRHG